MDRAKSKLDKKDLKRLKKEKKKRKEEALLKILDQRKEAQASIAAKPIPKNIVSNSSAVVTGRDYTVSVAIAGSILDNAQTPEFRTYLAGQVARAAAIFNIDEVVVFNDKKKNNNDSEDESSSGCVQMARILQYLECPQYLRRHFFPIHNDLKHAGVLAPTDMPHHLRAEEESVYREGVVQEYETKDAGTCWVNIGLKRNCLVQRNLKPGLRVTVKLVSGMYLLISHWLTQNNTHL